MPRHPAARQTRNPDRTRGLLLRAATRLFSERGYDGVAVDDIVAAAGVNKRMVYHYFGSKDGLYSEVLRDVFNRLAAIELKAVGESGSPEEAIAGILESYFAFLGENPEFVNLISWENLHQGQFVKRHPDLLSKNPVLGRLREAVGEGVALGVFHPGIDVKHLLISLISLCFVYHANRFTLSQSVGLDLQSPRVLKEGLTHTIDLVLNGLKQRKSEGAGKRSSRVPLKRKSAGPQ